jgi:acetoacetyl-CoA synthetase
MNHTLWTPKHPETCQMWHFLRFIENTYQQHLISYHDLHTWSIDHPALFWQALCDYFNITFTTPVKQVLNDERGMFHARWFTGASLNFAEQLLSRDDAHPAIVSLDEQGKRIVLSYHDLRQQVSHCAAGLKYAGVVSGSRIAAIMPNVTYTVIAMLATASIGAIWASCSSDFGVSAAVDRLSQIEPEILFVCDGHDYHGKTHLELSKIQEVSAHIPSLKQIVVCPVKGCEWEMDALPKSLLWDDFLRPSDTLDFAQLPFDHPLYILFSSGTTGLPKCIIHGAGGTLLQHVKELGLHTDIQAEDTLFFYTTCGWMMWNWMVSTLFFGATLMLYEGSPAFPDAMRLFQMIEDEQVSVFGTSPKFLSTVKQSGLNPIEHRSMPQLRCILSTGAPLMPEHYEFVYQNIKPDVQLSSISGGTDIVSCFALGNPLLPVHQGELQCAGLGMALKVYNEDGEAIQQTRGELVCTQAFPSMPVGFWNDPDKTRYHAAYFSRFDDIWAQGDFAEITANNGLIIYGRSDAVLNPGGVRIGTSEIYRQIEKIPSIIDSVVIGQHWENDVRIVLFVKLHDGCVLDNTLEHTIRQMIRTNASPRHVPSKILQVRDIPRTMNGKLVEVAVRQVVEGLPVKNKHSLVNPEALEYFKNRPELD